MKGLFVLSLLVLVALSFTGTHGQESTCTTKLASCSTNPPDAYMACIDKSFIQAVSSFLPEGKAVDKKYLNPKDWNPNVIFDFTNESLISGHPLNSFKGYINITLFWEGAGYRNQFGYFVYDTNSKGEASIRRDSKGNKMQYIYFKDVSFPNPDKSKDKGACLQSGVSVDIGPFFHGDNVGFVVWPNWYNSKSLEPLYSIPTLNDGDEVHFFVFSLQDKFVLGIEDVILKSADKDYNDVVFQFQTTKGATVEVPKLDPCPGEVPCSGHGICNATSKSCICQSGPTATYFGNNCENSYICTCQQGVCISDGVCSCDDRFNQTDCSSCVNGRYGYPNCKECDHFCDDGQTCKELGGGEVACITPEEPKKTPQCATYPWGIDASHYNVFVRGNFEGYNSDVQGRIAAGGNINLSLYSLAEALNPNDDDTLSCDTLVPKWAAVAGGDFTWDKGNARIGYLGYGATDNIDNSVEDGLGANCRVVSAKGAIDFKDAFNYFASVSSYFAKLDSNGETYLDKKENDKDKKTLYFNAPKTQPSDFIFTFNVKGEDLSTATSVIFGGFNDMAVKMLIINVDNDGKFTFKDTSFDTVLHGPSVTLSRKIVWNFHNADTIRIKSIAVPGTLLAPSSFVKGTDGVFWGQIFAASFEGDLQVNLPVDGEAICFMTDLIEKIPKTSAVCPPCSADATQKDDCTCICKHTCPAPYFADPSGECGCVCPVNNDCVLGQDPETCLCYGASTPAVDSSYCSGSYEGKAWPDWMTDFQIVTKEDLTLKSTRTGGRIAAGGSTNLKRIAVGDRLSNSKNPDCASTEGQVVKGVILANGPLFFQSGSVSGNIIAGDYTQLPEYLCVPLQVKQGLLGCDLPRSTAELGKAGAWNFAEGFKQLQSFSDALGDETRTTATGQAIYAYDVLTLWGYGRDLEIFRVNSDILKKARRIDLKGIKSTATIIIDIQGSSVSIRDVGTVSLLPFARSLIWNAAKAGSFSFKNVALPGLIVAPNADIENPVGRLLGGAFVKSFYAKGNVGIEWPFASWAGCLPKTELLGNCAACPAGQKRLNPTNCACTSVVAVRTSSVANFYGGAVVTFKFDVTGQPPTAVTVNFPNDGICKIQLNKDNNEPNVFTLKQKTGSSAGYTFETPSYAGFSADGLSFVAVFENTEAGEFPCTTVPIPTITSVSYEPITADD